MKKKNVFISYSGFDKSKVKSLFIKLKKTVLLDPLVVEYDRSTMTYLPNKIIENLKKADYIIPILTNRSINTQYMNQEIGYARALDIPVIPIVEQEIMADLRGFINSQNDLPYNFKSFQDEPWKEQKAFRNCCNILIEDLTSNISKSKSKITTIGLSDIFKGQWSNHFVFPDGQSGTEPFQIKKNNRYYIEEKYMFRLDKIFISKDKKSIQFRKNGVNDGDNRKVMNILRLKSPGIYVGDEEGNKVTYSKMQ